MSCSRAALFTGCVAVALGAWALPAPADDAPPARQQERGAHQMVRLTVGLGDVPANGNSRDAVPSRDGRFVAFTSRASNLVADDTNGLPDVFRLDTATGGVVAVSATPGGTTGDGRSSGAAITPSGRFVVFESAATDLVTPGKALSATDVYRFDAATGATVLVSRPTVRDGYPGSAQPSVSANGRWIAFTSRSARLTSDDTDGRADVFVFDVRTQVTTRVSPDRGISYQPDLSANGRFVAYTIRVADRPSQVVRQNLATGVTTLVSTTPRGRPGNRPSQEPTISGDGRFVAFDSTASDLVPGDGNGQRDVFVFDARPGRVKLVSVDRDGRPANGPSKHPDLSLDGRNIVFQSIATDLIGGRPSRQATVYERYLGRGGSTVLGAEPLSGRFPNGRSASPAISGAGSSWVFDSNATNIVPPDTRTVDVFQFTYS